MKWRLKFVHEATTLLLVAGFATTNARVIRDVLRD